MSDLNKTTLTARLTRDPETKTVGNATLTSFSVANGRKYKSNNETKEEVNYFDCQAWGKLGEIIQKYCTKGKQVAISGRLKQDRWKDDKGASKSRTYILVEEFQMLGSKPDSSNQEQPPEPENWEDEPF